MKDSVVLGQKKKKKNSQHRKEGGGVRINRGRMPVVLARRDDYRKLHFFYLTKKCQVIESHVCPPYDRKYENTKKQKARLLV